MSVTREQFFSLKPKFKVVDVPELGEGVQIHVHAINAQQKVRYLSGFWKPTGPNGDMEFDASGCRARLLILTCHDGEPGIGVPLFKAEDGPAIEAYNPDVVERLAEAADEVSGTQATVEELRDSFRRAMTFASPTS